MADRPVTEEALVGMMKALDEFVEETDICIQQMQNDANTCADNMNGDQISAQAIIRVNRCLGHYRQLRDRAAEIRKKMHEKYVKLQELKDMVGSDS